MPQVNFVIRLNDGGTTVPMRHVYVERVFKKFGLEFPIPGTYITNANGEVTDEDGNAGITAPLKPNGRIDIRVLCHNATVRVGSFGPFDDFIDFEVADGDTVTIPSSMSQFRVANRCAEVYDEVLTAFEPFASRRFLLGERQSLPATRHGGAIEVAFPTPAPAPLSFVQPSATFSGQPVVHFKDDDPRLFGTGDSLPTLIAAELAHAAHFSLLTGAQRDELTATYVHFIASDLRSGGTGTHTLKKETSPTVAFIEAFDHLLHRLDTHRRANGPVKTAAALQGFIDSERAADTFGTFLVRLTPPTDVDRSNVLTRRLPGVTGITQGLRFQFVPDSAFLSTASRSAASIEGSVYGALFLEFGNRVGLKTVVETYLASQALNVGEYRTWISNNRSDLSPDLDETFAIWTL